MIIQILVKNVWEGVHKMANTVLQKNCIGSIMGSSFYGKKSSYSIKSQSSVLGTKIKKDKKSGFRRGEKNS